MLRQVILQYSKDMTAGRLARGYDHCNRVYHLAKHLAEEYDDDILYAATFLHDIILSEPHQLQSAEKAESILHEVGFEPEKIPAVKEAIMNHIPEGSPTTIEAKMLHDADILDSLGIVGMTRLAIGAFFWKGAKTMETVCRLIKEYKTRAESHLILEKSKVIAEKKLRNMDSAIKNLEEELSMLLE